MKLIRLDPQEFDALIATKKRMAEKTIILLRDVLVGGMSRNEAAKKHGVTRTRVQTLVGIIEKAHFEKIGRSDTVISVQLTLPAELAIALSQFAKLADTADSNLSRRCVDEVMSAISSATDRLMALSV